MLLKELVDISNAVAATPRRSEKIEFMAGLISRVDTTEIEPVVGFLSADPIQGKVGVGWATGRVEGRAGEASLGIADLDKLFSDLAAMSGEGVQESRRSRLEQLGARATPDEAEFVTLLLTGELRQGALAGVVEQGAAKSLGVPAAVLHRAAMLLGDLPGAVLRARVGGRPALEAVGLSVGVPIQPMLASSAPSTAEGLEGIEAGRVEWKLDGIRIQAHRGPAGVRLFTRNLNDVTSRLPQVVEQVMDLDVTAAVIDGEVIGVDESERPLAFQDSLAGSTVLGHWFDLLHLDGRDWMDEPLAGRGRVLDEVVGDSRVSGVDTSVAAEVAMVFDQSILAGHEGIVIKDLSSTYQAGRRGKSWRKVKPVHTLDLVVIAVEWGSGRRKGWLSNLHLGALGPSGEPVMVGKTFKGLTDELLTWQTEELLERAVATDGHIVRVRPELVVEIALDGAQRSTRYPGGVALRFARVRRYRTDRGADSADSLDAVRALLH